MPEENKTMRFFKGRTFIICFFTYLCANICRVVLSVALPMIKEDYAGSAVQVGAISTGFFLVYALGQLLNGYIGDRVESRRYVTLAMLGAAVCNFLLSFVTPLPAIIAFWALNGFFQSMIWGPMMRIVAAWFQGKGLGRVSIGMAFSGICAFLFCWGMLSQLLLFIHWRLIFRITAGIAALAAVIFFLFIRTSPNQVGLSLEAPGEGETGVHSPPPAKGLRETIDVITKTHLWPVAGSCIMHGIIKEGVAVWTPLLIMQMLHVDIGASAKYSLLIPLIDILGILFAALLLRRKGAHEKSSVALMFFMTVLFCGGLFFTSRAGMVLSVVLLGLSSAMMRGSNTFLLSVIPLSYKSRGMISSVAGFLDFMVYLGAGLSGILSGVIAETLGWSAVAVFWATAALLGGGLVLLPLKRKAKLIS